MRILSERHRLGSISGPVLFPRGGAPPVDRNGCTTARSRPRRVSSNHGSVRAPRSDDLERLPGALIMGTSPPAGQHSQTQTVSDDDQRPGPLAALARVKCPPLPGPFFARQALCQDSPPSSCGFRITGYCRAPPISNKRPRRWRCDAGTEDRA
jgi:hypothetical protein